MELTYYNDHKEKDESYRVDIMEDETWVCKEPYVYTHNPLEICGYGATKEEALNNFIIKFEYVMAEWKAFEQLLLESDVLTNNIIEVDCLGKRIDKG